MIRKIILNIRHSDDYTDYLLMTSALTDKRIVPLLDPNDNVLQLVTDSKTLVLRCEASNGEPRERRKPGPGLFINQGKGEVVVFPKYYYHADGSIDSTHAELRLERCPTGAAKTGLAAHAKRRLERCSTGTTKAGLSTHAKRRLAHLLHPHHTQYFG